MNIVWDNVMPEQFVQPRPAQPEMLMLAAMLERAVHDYSADAVGRGVENLRSDARRWIDSESEREFSFNWVCEALSLDASVIRDGIRSKHYRIVRSTRPVWMRVR